MASKATNPDSKALNFVFLILKHVGAVKPNYHAAAKEAGMCNANKAQTKYRTIIEGAGFKLVNGAVVASDGPEAHAAAAALSKRGRKRKVSEENAETGAKKRKMDAADGDDEAQKTAEEPADQDYD